MNLFRTSAAAFAIAAVSTLPAIAADAIVYEEPVVLQEEVDPAPLNGSTLSYGFDHEGGPR
ncbi:hypothetical protein [Aliihoeflea sp. 40Bstr573]|uniref:hypothetical protein n=1 Tax=Aliihoeflea sp. 40Bstr573 TaxID=2696467 RepID=UPI0020964D85|nr:hypothetical protein [Aliihoeflea sp. 40Bstr573]MCO6389007.1 hypothetical protein [Aliihoeflea sp. 40Bstr573]